LTMATVCAPAWPVIAGATVMRAHNTKWRIANSKEDIFVIGSLLLPESAAGHRRSAAQ